MKYFVASDIHGDSYWAERVVNAFAESKADKLVLLGDILYHGPRNDLPAHYEPKKVIEILNNIADTCRQRQLRYRSRPDGIKVPYTCRLHLPS